MITNNNEYDFVIVGAGIAGLAIAEFFSRSGHTVALLEKNNKICTEASGAHHGWFHFGSLYSIFPNNQFMRTLVGGIDDLLDYYNEFPGMNIKVNKNGKLFFPLKENAWIRDEVIQYIVSARNDRDFDLHAFNGIKDYIKKLFFVLTWDLAIKQFISRHQRFHKFDWRQGPASESIPKAGWLDYSREVIHKVGDLDICLDKDTHFRVSGFDRAMNSTNIIKELFQSFVNSGGVFVGSCEISRYQRIKDRIEIRNDDKLYLAKNLIFSSGKALKHLLAGKVEVNVVASPLLVVYPAVCDVNMVRLTPFVNKTINHIRHDINGKSYSLIGGGYFVDPDDHCGMARVKEDLQKMTAAVFPQISQAEMKEVYFSCKTEISAERGERNYQYYIRQIEENVFGVVPGKFSLAFSLAVNAYKRIVGVEPKTSVSFNSQLNVSKYLDVMRHESIVSNYIRQRAINQVKHTG